MCIRDSCKALGDFHPACVADAGGDGLQLRHAIHHAQHGRGAVRDADGRNGDGKAVAFCDKDRSLGKHARADGVGIGQCDAGAAKPRCLVDAGFHQPNAALKLFALAHQSERGRLACGKPGQVRLGHVGTQFQRAVADHGEHRLTCGRGDGTDLGIAGGDFTRDGGLHLGPRQLQIDVLDLRLHQGQLRAGGLQRLRRDGHLSVGRGCGGLRLIHRRLRAGALLAQGCGAVCNCLLYTSRCV